MHPGKLQIKEYNYILPDELIARYPLTERDNSRLLVAKNKAICEDIYRNMVHHLPENSLVIFNNTKVVEARLIFSKTANSTIEVFCLEPADGYKDITTAMQQHGSVTWKCLIGGAKKWKPAVPLSKHFIIADNSVELRATLLEKKEGYFIISFSWNKAFSFAEILHAAGLIPLPPYLGRPTEESDSMNYQTLYAKHEGSVAAPTAGLHFTPYIFEQMAHKKISREFVTLHVGAGTFKPVQASVIEEHEMHAEFIEINKPFVEKLINQMHVTIVAVGTTSLRTIESLYWMGLKIKANPKITAEELPIGQWEAYNPDTILIEARQALQCLLDWMSLNKLDRLFTKTQIMIAPGYKFKITQALITNFHQPQSTLLLLVAALIGDQWKNVYHHALENNFRFLSYGDGCLLWNSV